MRPIDEKIKSELEDYFYNKTKDFIFEDYEEDERRAEVDDYAISCIEDIMHSLKYYNDKIDDYLLDYDFYRKENREEYENDRHQRYGIRAG